MPGPQDQHSTSICACATLRRVSRAVTQLYDLVLTPAGIKATQFFLLKSIFEAGEITQCHYSREQAVAVETLSRRLGGLRRKGLVEMRRGERHGERIYTLTANGRKTFADALPHWERAQHRLKRALGPKEWRALVEICDRVCRAAHDAEEIRTSNHVHVSSPGDLLGSFAAD